MPLTNSLRTSAQSSQQQKHHPEKMENISYTNERVSGHNETMYFSTPQAKIQFDLRKAIFDLNKRGLKYSAKWCAELLMGLIDNSRHETYEINPYLGMSTKTSDRYQLAKSFFDLGEYLRAANVLSFTQIGQRIEKSNSSLFRNMQSDGNLHPYSASGVHENSDGHFLRKLDEHGNNGKMNQQNPANITSRSGYNNLFENGGTEYGFGDGIGKMESNRTLFEIIKKKIHIEETDAPAFVLHQEELFLRSYSLYLAGEKYREEKLLEISNDVDKSSIVNPYIHIILDELGPLYTKGDLDGLNVYLYGIALRQVQRSLWKRNKDSGYHDEDIILGRNNEKMETCAQYKSKIDHDYSNNMDVSKEKSEINQYPNVKDVLTDAVVLYPWNWSAWLDLGDILMESDATHTKSNGIATGGAVELSREATSRLIAEGHDYILAIFYATVNGEQHHCWEALEHIESVQALFPTSSYLLAQTAVAYYNLRDFDKSHEIFQRLRKRDPYRLENLERFSDILYVKENKADLSQLAHEAVKVDKYRAETCCIVGNYYSLKGHHEKAIMYFQRALKLNSNFLFAWTLMGHGYLEMKHTGAAIEAYRSAVDINPRDYKAWYGLGQTYELLQMYFYALYYYRKVTMLRPYDSRMWFALGLSFEKLDRLEEAKRSYERAVVNNDREGNATSALAKLYKDEGDMDKAAKYYQILLSSRDPNVVEGVEALEALVFLAHYSKDKGEYQRAKDLCVRLMDYPGQGQEEAKIVLRSLRAIELHKDLNSPDGNLDYKHNEERHLRSRRTSFTRLNKDNRRSSEEGVGVNSFISPMPSRQLHRTPSYSRQTNIHDDYNDDDGDPNNNNNDNALRDADTFSDSMMSDM